MDKQHKDAQILNDEFTKIFDDYRARIDEITRRTQVKLMPDNAPSQIMPAAVPEQPEAATPPVPEEPPDKPEIPATPINSELPVVKESEVIIKEAKRKAQQIIAEAEESIKKEARKKTQAQADKIIGKAQKEAEDIINRAAQAVDRERSEAIFLLKQESEKVIREITEKCRKDAQAQSSQIIIETRGKAAKMITDITTSSTEIGQRLDEIINSAKKTVAEFETKLQTDMGELAKAISETQNKLLQITMVSREETPEPALPDRNKEADKGLTLAVHLLNDRPSDEYSSNGLFRGQVEMKSVSSSFNSQYLKNLKKYLVDIPGIKYLQESASERGISLLVDVKEPLPLLDILNSIPLIDEVDTMTDEDIYLIFKSIE